MKKILYLLFLTFYFRADICLAQSAVNCATAGTIACGTNFTGTTAGAGNDFNASDFPCNQTSSPFNGNDRVYKISVTTSGYHTFKLTELSADLDIFLLTNACENGTKIKDACIDFSANPNQNDEIIGPIYLEAGAPYYLIIDAFEASITSTFRIQVQCPVVSTTNFCTSSANVRPLTLKDNFEAYTLGNIAPQSSKWRLWRINSGDGLISSDRSFSGAKSLKIQSANPSSDVIYQMGYLNQGRYRISWKMYIPSGKTGYYNLLHKYDNPEHWAYHVYFSENGSGQIKNQESDINFNYEYNKWFSVTQIVDISNDKVELFIAGKYLGSWKFTNSSDPNSYNNKLAAINFAAVTPKDQFYVDDICIRKAGCFDCVLFNQNVCMYPGNEMDKCLAACSGYEEEEWNAGNCTPTNNGNCPECFQCFTWRKGNNENEIYFDNNYCEEQVLGYSDKLESRNAVTYDWDFGSESVTFLEGTNRNSQNPRCKFPRPGKFKICFKVYRSNVLLFECCKIVHVNPCSKPPVPQLTYTINETNGEVQFDASATTDAEVYEWDFGGGDALITHDIKPKRRYQNGRCYTVCYYASNGCGTSKICITVCPGYSPCMNRPLPPKAPVPNFNITDDVLQISGLSQGEYEKIEWILPSDISFEAGSTVNTWNPKCKFKKPGYHTVCAIIYFKCHKVCFCWTVYYPGCCQNGCLNAEELLCGSTLSRSTLNTTNKFSNSDYTSCRQFNSNFDGNDIVFKYKHTADRPNANIVLWDLNADLDMFLITSCGTPASCIKYSANNDRNYEYIDMSGLPPGDYYIVVDGFNSGQKSNFKISIACQYICSNGLGESLGCGKAVSGTTVAGVNYFHKYGCTNSFKYTGNEKLYHFTAPDDGNYTIDLTGFTGDLDLFILKSEFNCNALPVCIESSNNEAGKNEQKIIQLKKGEHIDIIIDGSLGNNSAFTLKVSCPNPVTNNCPDCFQCFTWRKGSNDNEIYFDNNYCEDFIPVLNSLESRSAVSYQWDFAGENVTFLESTNRNSQHPKCKFPRAGRYKICLKVFRGSSLLFECCKTIIINPCTKPPVPQLTYSINESNGEVQFDASAATDVESYEWDFGGGTDVTINDTKPKRRYPGGRCYTVCLYTSNGCGTSKICITVCPGYSPCMNRPISPKAPVPNFTITDDILQISGNTQGEYEKIEWTLPSDISFEAGSTLNTWNPKLKFKKPGYHTICAIIYFKCHKVCFCWTVYYPGCCQNRCANVKEITCGTRYEGSTLNNGNSFSKSDYSNCNQSTNNFDGNDVVYKYKHTASWPAASILLWGYTDDLDLLLLNSCGTPATCVKSSTSGTRKYEFIDLTGLPAGDYFIVVDGKNATQKSEFKISVACQQGCTDPATIVLNCNTSVVGNTEICEINFNNKYSCDPDYRFSGPECYYRFTAPEAGEYTFDLFGFGNKNLDLFILDYNNCNSTPACIKYSANNIPGQAEQVQITLAKNQLITVVVDGSFGDAGEYALTTLCAGFATTKLTFDIDDNICDAKGKTIQVPVKVLNFTNIRSFQMSLKSENSSIVSIKSINSSALSGVDFIEIEAGKTFNIFYNKQTPLSLPDGSTAFTIEVELKGNVNQSSKLFFTNSPLDIKAGQFVNNVTSSVPVDVKDGSSCIANSTISLIGKITTAMNTGINNVIVKLSGQQTAETKTNTDGNYNFANLSTGANYTITPEKNVNANNGLDIFDLSFLQDMIIGRTLVANPYKLLAADINRDGALDIFDLGELQDIIIGRRTIFSNNTSWVFLPKSENLTIQKVNSNTYTKSITITNASASRSDLDFYGVKIGDLVEDANPKDLTNETNNENQVEVRSVGSFSIQLPDLKATKEQIIYVPVTLTKFKDIRAFQFNVSWNNAQLEYLGIDQFSKDVNSFTENNILKIEYGKLNVVWLNNNNLSLPDNTKLFYIKFKVLASKGNILDLNFEGVKATELAGPVSDILSTNGKVTISDVSTSFYPKAKVESSIQLFPNPAIKYIMISSPFEYEFVEISDLNGRKVYSDHGKHQHQNNIDLSLYSSGVYILKIKIKDDIYFKKFVKE